MTFPKLFYDENHFTPKQTEHKIKNENRKIKAIDERLENYSQK